MDLDPGFSTNESRLIFGAAGRLRAMLDVEAALARASAAVGFIPREAAETIAGVCAERDFDARAIFTRGWDSGSPMIPLVAELKARVGDQAAAFVHRGATTQDIVDTGMVLQIRSGLAAADRHLLAIGARLAELTTEHRATPIRGRTLLQPAITTTFGAKAAAWLDAVVVDIERMRALDVQLPIQLGGMVGDAGPFGDHGPALVEDLASRLELTVPRYSWHTRRGPVMDTATALASAARTASKIANDLALLAQGEVGEVSMRAGASSAMAGKRNPIDAARTRAAAQLALGQAAALLTSPPYEHERAAGPWQAEWALIPILFNASLAALEALGKALESLRVDGERMAANLGGRAAELDPRTPDTQIDRVVSAYERLIAASRVP